jgi:PleD family two-component response regulator
MEKKKILLVDDDEIQREIIEHMLNDEYDVIKARSGNDALNHLYHNDFIPNLILLDILMPDMDGWEVFTRIRAISLLKNVPIAFLTTIDESDAEKKAYEIGAIDFIRKSNDKEALIARVKNIIPS